MIIEIDDDITDKIIRDTLVRDYLHLCSQISNFERRDNLTQADQEDFNSWLKTVTAIDILFDFYLIASDAEEIRSQGKRS